MLASKDGVGGATSWSATDQIGSMRKWTNDSGSAGSYSAVFDAFGQVVSQSGSRPPYGFGADWTYRDDGDAGLLHIGARWYDPVVGRWITADRYLGSIFDPLSLNRYLYCKDDPVNMVDPSGLWTLDIDLGLVHIGVRVDRGGWHPYIGLAPIPGIGGYIGVVDDLPGTRPIQPGLFGAVGGNIIFGGEVGYGTGGPFGSLGVGVPPDAYVVVGWHF